ncbi:complement C1q tumor necrosis factor-related protein 3-like [Mercenaria mercenaria]|uniref:complement C1q tumor necrosis factor-related protein 3-like n=1 Tax=Mercenaria mercenaria TaxID=6596 RepID=UPI00234E6841|nr:complement C1q tumor necrosis factor-related protein 3-like [Mercenaria mercenaria]
MLIWTKMLGQYHLALCVVILFFLPKTQHSILIISSLVSVFPKFDYDYKVMQKLLRFEREIKEPKQRNACTDTKHVAFMAELSADLVDPSSGTTVVFDSVRTNVGDGYKSGPGIFVAPVNGTYSKNIVASSGTKAASSNLHLYIMQNKIQVGYVYLDDNSDRWLLRSTTAVLELNASDTVFVKVGFRRGAGNVEAVVCIHTSVVF